jgi:predicted component of type VI protein secretion system
MDIDPYALEEINRVITLLDDKITGEEAAVAITVNAIADYTQTLTAREVRLNALREARNRIAGLKEEQA